MTSSALVEQGRGVDGDTGPISHVGWRQRLLRCDVAEPVGRPAPEGATRRGEHEAAYLVGATGPQALRERGVLAVDRDDLAGAASRVTSGPPMISDSLLASASVRPASSAASVGRSPTAPVMALSTTSHSSPAASVEASGPARSTPARTPPPAARTAPGSIRPRSAPPPGSGRGSPAPGRGPASRPTPSTPAPPRHVAARAHCAESAWSLPPQGGPQRVEDAGVLDGGRHRASLPSAISRIVLRRILPRAGLRQRRRRP